MKRTKRMCIMLIAAMCMCVCMIVILSVNNRVNAEINFDKGRIFYLGGENSIKIPLKPVDKDLSAILMKKTDDGVVPVECSSLGHSPLSIGFSPNIPDGVSEQVYYICLTEKNVQYDSVMQDLFDSIEKGVTYGENSLEMEFQGESIHFEEITVNAVEQPFCVMSIKVGGEDISKAKIISQETEIEFGLKSMNVLNIDTFEDWTFYADGGSFRKIGVEQDETDGHLYRAKYMFEPYENAVNMSAGIDVNISDECGAKCKMSVDGVLRIDKQNIRGEFENDTDLGWTNEESVTLVLRFNENEDNGINYLDMITTDDLTITNDEFSGKEIVLKKNGDDVHAEVTVKCDENKAASAKVNVDLNIHRDGVDISKSFNTRDWVSIDRIPPKIEPKEYQRDTWNAGIAYMEYDVYEHDSGIDETRVYSDEDSTGLKTYQVGPERYRYEIDIAEGSTVDKVNITITASDNAGNVTVKELTDMQVLIDNSAPTIEVVEGRYYDGGKKFDYENEWINRKVYLLVKLRDDGSGIDESNINSILRFTEPELLGSEIKVSIADKNEDEYEAYITIDPGQNKLFSGKVKLRAEDRLGLVGYSDEFTLNIDTEAPDISSIEFEKVGSETEAMPQYVGDYGEVRVKIKTTDKNGSGADSLKIKLNGSNRYFTMKKEGSDSEPVFTAVIPMDGGGVPIKDGERIAITDLVLSDKANNQKGIGGVHGTASEIYYYTAMRIGDMDVKYSSDNGDMFVKDGDKIELSFVTLHDVDCFDSIVIGGKEGSFEWERTDKDGGLKEYKGTYSVKHMPENDNGEFDTSVRVVDRAGNSVTIDSGKLKDKIRYYAPIEDSVSGLSFKVNGSNKNFARNGDRLQISFMAKHPVEVSNAKIAGRDVTFTCDDGLRYSAELVIGAGQITDNTDITYSFELSDAAGNRVYSADQGMTAAVRYYSPLSVSELKMSSDNAQSSYTAAKNGDVVTVTFVTNHPSEVRDASIGGHKLSFTSSDRINWTAQMRVAEGMAADMGYLPLRIVIADAAGNDVVTKTENDLASSKIRYVAPISISDVSFIGTNEKDPARAAKSGDTIKVSFVANHGVTVNDAVIGGKNADVSVSEAGGEKRRYELKVAIGEGELADQADINFSFKATDMAGNDPVSVSNGSMGMSAIRYYAPITTAVSIAADGKDSAYVKNGGKITVSGSANHPVKPEECKIMGKDANGSGGYSTNYTVSYSIAAGERALPEAKAAFEFVLTDAAGNTLDVNEVTDESSVRYDRTAPVLDAEYERVNFTNSTMTYKFTFSDANLAPDDISIQVNGTEQIKDEERKAITSTVFVKEIKVGSDANYTIYASAVDRAGNASDPVEIRMTVDKTAPEIKTVSVSKNKPQVYKNGFVIKDHLEINEANLKEVIVTVTNANGTTDWDINEPITTEGKNTVYIVATDMANNTSEAVTFDFYIDTTAPKPIVLEKKSDLFLYTDKEVVFSSQADIEVSLEPLHVEGVNEPDKFTKLCITDKDGKVLYDLLDGYESAANKGTYFISLTATGEYNLLIEAEDQVGNNTGEMKYVFRIEEQTVIAKVADNKLLAVGTATGGGAAVVIIGCAIVLKRFRRKRLG